MKLNALKRAATSRDGAWFVYPSGEQVAAPTDNETLFVRVAEADNPRYREVRARLYRDNRMALQPSNPGAAELRKQLEVRIQAETILVDWANLTEEDGAVIPYSPEKAAEFLGNPAMWAFAQFVVDVSSVDLFYREKEEAGVAGN